MRKDDAHKHTTTESDRKFTVSYTMPFFAICEIYTSSSRSTQISQPEFKRKTISPQLGLRQGTNKWKELKRVRVVHSSGSREVKSIGCVSQSGEPALRQPPRLVNQSQ
ncbi:hypothetical protein KC19_3G131900 [Ceratodon purpureus]|uniref:Uncharacterized protein n=1 Tax=Ceratodon purpureus TaxID=3225 RepID=A0A8T0IKF9_CERPU|nr:hypothetical protein KC19_3G131900 [Ceratodon purpureus]